MASQQGARKGRVLLSDGTVVFNNSPIGKQISSRTQPLISLSIQEWRRAIDSARNRFIPRRRPLIDLFDNVIFDGHLESVMEKRRMGVTNKKMLFTVNGKQDEKIQKLIHETSWFSQFTEIAMSAIDNGYALPELVPGRDGLIEKVVNTPLGNILPDYKFLAWNWNTFQPGPNLGVYYEDDPQHSPYLVEVKSKYPLGKLATASCYIILKRGSMSDWADFCQLFGIPIRVGKYNPFDDTTRKKLEEALENVVGGGWMAIPEGTSVDVHTSNTGAQSSVFKDMAEICNAEMSKLYLGNTMTTDNGSSKSQGEVHERVEDGINVMDMLWYEHLVNGALHKKLSYLGYKIPEEGRSQFPETSSIPLKDRILIDAKLNEIVPIGDEYFYKTFGVPTPTPEQAQEWRDKKATSVPVTAPPIKEEEDADPEKPVKKAAPKKAAVKNALTSSLHLLYKTEGLLPLTTWPVMASSKKRDKIIERITREMYSGKLKPGEIDKELFEWIKAELMEAITLTLKDNIEKELYAAFVKGITHDVHVFSAFKTYQELRLCTDLLTDSTGTLRTFSQFKELVIQLDSTYNVTYLAAEYQQAVATTQMGMKWQEFESMREVAPMLRFETAGDDRVRDEHRILDGLVLHIDDSFWDNYYPPIGWGCRCDVTQVLADAVRSELPAELPKVNEMFAVNWGKKKIVFPPKHDYYKVRSADQSNADNLWGLNESV